MSGDIEAQFNMPMLISEINCCVILAVCGLAPSCCRIPFPSGKFSNMKRTTIFANTSFRLCIETGRWHKPQQIPLIDRKCSVYNVLEDEYHFVLECCLYEGLRKKFLPVYYYKRPYD